MPTTVKKTPQEVRDILDKKFVPAATRILATIMEYVRTAEDAFSEDDLAILTKIPWRVNEIKMCELIRSLEANAAKEWQNEGWEGKGLEHPSDLKNEYYSIVYYRYRDYLRPEEQQHRTHLKIVDNHDKIDPTITQELSTIIDEAAYSLPQADWVQTELKPHWSYLFGIARELDAVIELINYRASIRIA